MAKNYFIIGLLVCFTFIVGNSCKRNVINKKENQQESTIKNDTITSDSIFVPDIEKNEPKIVPDTQKNEPKVVLTQREQLTKTFRFYIGVKEATGSNDGEEVRLFLKSTNLAEGFAWCAAFVNYCHLLNNVPTPPKTKAAWCPSWFPSNKIINKEKSTTGDVFGIYYAKLGRIGHVGFIDEKWDNNSNFILTVEGNTNSDGHREGDGVYRKRRSKNLIRTISQWVVEES